MKRIIGTGSLVSRSEYFFLQNSSNLSGLGLAGVSAASSNLTAGYTRERANFSVVSLIDLASAASDYVSGGFVEVSQVSQLGLYRFDVPDAAFATGVSKCVVSLMYPSVVPCMAEYQIDTDTDFDPGFGIPLRGTIALWSGSGTTNGALGQLTRGALTAATAGDWLCPTGFQPRVMTTFDSSTGSYTVDAFPSSVSSVAFRVVSIAPADSTIPVYADVVKVSGDATAANNAESFFDGTGYAGTGNTIPTVTTVTGGATAALLSAGTTELLAQFPSGFSAAAPSTATNVVAVITQVSALSTSVLAQFPSNFSAAVITSGGTLPARVESLVSAYVKGINATAVTGDGSTTPWGPA